jgi:hypothetical protein
MIKSVILGKEVNKAKMVNPIAMTARVKIGFLSILLIINPPRFF